MSKFEIGLASIMGVLVLGILALIAASPDSTPSGVPLSMIEMNKNFAMEEESEMMKEEMMESEKNDVGDTAFVSIPLGSATPACAETNECFAPFNAEVISGGTVTWSNDDVSAHTVTSGTVSEGHNGIFDSSLFLSGSTFEYTFEDSGMYDYYCIVHPWMIGTVQVQ